MENTVLIFLGVVYDILFNIFQKRGLPRDWNDSRFNNRRYIFIGQTLGSDGKYYAVLRFVGLGFTHDFSECCYVMGKPLPDTPMFDRGNSVDEITAVNLGGDPIFKPWKPA